MKPTKEYLNKTIKELKRKVGLIQFDNKILQNQIKTQKDKILPNTSVSHEILWDLRRILKLNQEYAHLIKLEILKLEKQRNDLYNENNIKNISKHGIMKRFLSCKNPRHIMYKMNWYCDTNKTFSQNCKNFVNEMDKRGKLNELKEILYGKFI